MRTHYQEDDGTAYTYLLNPSGGVLQHDRLYTEIVLEENSKVYITTPSSTKFYKMDDGHAEVVNKIKMCIRDSPAIAKLLIDEEITPLSPYKRPMTKKGFFRKHEYVYDEYYDCYLCPGDQILKYATTNRDGYREYKSDGNLCANCPYLSQCTESKNHVKILTRHIWEGYMEICEDIRHTIGMKELYGKRKETIERNFCLLYTSRCV